jgi:orotidine-5'-phosphate decarboxylase
MKPQLIVALDVPSATEISPILDRLPDAIHYYKVGLELFSADGPDALKPITARGKNIFLDLKLHDIPQTVSRAVKAVAAHHASLLTVHAGGGPAMLKAAAQAAAEIGHNAPKLIAVTTLTSLDDTDLAGMGVSQNVAEHSLSLGKMALDAGIDGLVCSVREAGSLRDRFGAAPLLVTPGIRLPNAATHDQKRVATPAEAARAGSSFLVVGRPILSAPDPHAAASEILRQIDDACAR